MKMKYVWRIVLNKHCYEIYTGVAVADGEDGNCYANMFYNYNFSVSLNLQSS